MPCDLRKETWRLVYAIRESHQGENFVPSETTQVEIMVVNAKGARATIIAVPNPSRSVMDDSEAELIYGMHGLVVEKISESEFRDFQRTIWTADGTLAPG